MNKIMRTQSLPTGWANRLGVEDKRKKSLRFSCLSGRMVSKEARLSVCVKSGGSEEKHLKKEDNEG